MLHLESLAAYPLIVFHRICSRTWDKDPFLHAVAQKFIFARGSITRRIQNSEVFKARFQANMARQASNPTSTRYLRSLSLAKHRFDSSSKPFCRAVVFFEALLATTQQVADERKGKQEGKEAIALLSTITEEECITLATLADAGEEAILLSRFLDDEEFDKSSLAPQLTDFLARTQTSEPTVSHTSTVSSQRA